MHRDAEKKRSTLTAALSASTCSCGMMRRCGAAKSALRDAYEWRRSCSARMPTKERCTQRREASRSEHRAEEKAGSLSPEKSRRWKCYRGSELRILLRNGPQKRLPNKATDKAWRPAFLARRPRPRPTLAPAHTTTRHTHATARPRRACHARAPSPTASLTGATLCTCGCGRVCTWLHGRSVDALGPSKLTAPAIAHPTATREHLQRR